MAQSTPPSQRKKLTQPEMYNVLLKMINSMNVSLSNAMSDINEAYLVDSKLPAAGLDSAKMTKINDKLNKVMSGITNLTSIYTEAHKRAIIQQGPVAAAVAAGVKDASTNTRVEAISKVANETIEAANEFKNGLNEVSLRLSEIAGKNNATEPPTYVGALDQLLGENGLMFSYLSSELHALGKGSLRPCPRFQAYIDNITQVPVENLVDYPEGFYNTHDGIPSQLYLKVGSSEFLWNFGLPEHEMFLRNESEWKSINTLTRSAVRVIITQLTAYLGNAEQLA